MDNSFIWAFLAALVSTIYFFLIKYYAQTKKLYVIGLVIVLELIVIYLYYKSVINQKSSIVYSIINGLSVIIGAILAIVFFGDQLSMMDVVGIAIIIIGILIVRGKYSRKV